MSRSRIMPTAVTSKTVFAGNNCSYFIFLRASPISCVCYPLINCRADLASQVLTRKNLSRPERQSALPELACHHRAVQAVQNATLDYSRYQKPSSFMNGSYSDQLVLANSIPSLCLALLLGGLLVRDLT